MLPTMSTSGLRYSLTSARRLPKVSGVPYPTFLQRQRTQDTCSIRDLNCQATHKVLKTLSSLLFKPTSMIRWCSSTTYSQGGRRSPGFHPSSYMSKPCISLMWIYLWLYRSSTIKAEKSGSTILRSSWRLPRHLAGSVRPTESWTRQRARLSGLSISIGSAFGSSRGMW